MIETNSNKAETTMNTISAAIASMIAVLANAPINIPRDTAKAVKNKPITTNIHFDLLLLHPPHLLS